MPTTHWKGVPVPEAGDDLLSAWPAALDAAGIVFPAQSVAAGREILSKAEAAGHPPTAAHPAYLDVGGVLYRSDGSKNGNTWILRPINEVQAVEASVPINNTLKLGNGQYRPYRARFPNDSTGATVTVTGIRVVPAGQDPKIRCGFTGAYGTGGTFSISGDSAYSTLFALAHPRSMA